MSRKVNIAKARCYLRTLLQVKAVAQQAFGCNSLIGFPLEDLPLGAGVHWEVRARALQTG